MDEAIQHRLRLAQEERDKMGRQVQAALDERDDALEDVGRRDALLARAVGLLMEVEGPGGTADPTVTALLADIAALDRKEAAGGR